jgi:hypothetical protein
MDPVQRYYGTVRLLLNLHGGAPRIHGELLNLGFEVSEPTVSRYLQRLKRQPDQSKVQRWLAFLQKHREVIAAFDPGR